MLFCLPEHTHGARVSGREVVGFLPAKCPKATAHFCRFSRKPFACAPEPLAYSINPTFFFQTTFLKMTGWMARIVNAEIAF
jgi:hypothetical protein